MPQIKLNYFWKMTLPDCSLQSKSAFLYMYLYINYILDSFPCVQYLISCVLQCSPSVQSVFLYNLPWSNDVHLLLCSCYLFQHLSLDYFLGRVMFSFFFLSTQDVFYT